MINPLWEVAYVFGRLGLTAFGGPAAHIAMMRREVVEERQWIDEREFMDLLSATNLIPGPNSTEMAIHLGYQRAGWRGLVVGGVCFIAPALIIVLVCAWLYVRFGRLPQATWLFDGLTPIILAIIAHALWKLRTSALHSPVLWALGCGATIAVLLGVNELVLLGATVVVMSLKVVLSKRTTLSTLWPFLMAPTGSVTAWSLGQLFGTFFKIGAVLYGSGYVLLAFLRADFVERLGWLTEQQLLDAVAVGQFTPGPVFTSATFIGYVVGAPHGMALPAALIATAGIFTPAFLFVALTRPLLARLQRSTALREVLDAINAVSLGLMAAVLIQLAVTTWHTNGLPWPLVVGCALGALVALWRTRINPTWLLIAGAVLSLVVQGLLIKAL